MWRRACAIGRPGNSSPGVCFSRNSTRAKRHWDAGNIEIIKSYPRTRERKRKWKWKRKGKREEGRVRAHGWARGMLDARCSMDRCRGSAYASCVSSTSSESRSLERGGRVHRASVSCVAVVGAPSVPRVEHPIRHVCAIPTGCR